MGVLSLLWGIVAMVLMFIGLVPLLGWSNWLIIPFAGMGAIIAAIGIGITAREKRGRAKTGLLLNALVMVIAAIRLSLGGGII
jgi:hypothetical protein